jgi:uncharacterized membrane protein YkvI
MHRAGQSKWLAFQVGCTYVGTVVGAGFASGQEIFQFFGRYGNWGFLSILLSVVLFAWLGYKVMYLGHRLQAHSYRELNAFLFGRTLGSVFDVVLVLMLFGVTVAMLAGAGALFRESLHVSFQVGALLTLAITYITIVRGIKGILEANTVIVPTMVSFVLFAAFDVLRKYGLPHIWSAGAMLTTHHPLVSLISGVMYAAFNIGLAAGVLIPLGVNVKDVETLRLGACMGAIALGSMLLAVTCALFAHYPKVMTLDIPMAYVASQIGRYLQWAFLFVLWGEIYSTLVGNVYSLGAQFGMRTHRSSAIVTGVILVLAYLGSQVGFSTMVTYVYGVFSWISTLFVFALVWPREKLPVP